MCCDDMSPLKRPFHRETIQRLGNSSLSVRASFLLLACQKYNSVTGVTVHPEGTLQGNFSSSGFNVSQS